MKSNFGYKLFVKDKGGNLHPLYVNANQTIPTNQWLTAECGEMTPDGKVKSKLGKLAYRGGWHLNEECPYVTHIYGKKYIAAINRCLCLKFRKGVLYYEKL